jgi:hypothetical protein
VNFIKKINWLGLAKVILFLCIILSIFIKIVAYITLGIMVWLTLGALAGGILKKAHRELPQKNDWCMMFSGIIPWIFYPALWIIIYIYIADSFPNLILYLSSGFHLPKKTQK